ncbi:MAG: hypothetical protein WBQ09_14850 [Terriglobales bacterium]
MKRTISAIALAAAIMLAVCATPALGEGPGPPPSWPPKAQVAAPVLPSLFGAPIHLL